MTKKELEQKIVVLELKINNMGLELELAKMAATEYPENVRRISGLVEHTVTINNGASRQRDPFLCP